MKFLVKLAIRIGAVWIVAELIPGVYWLGWKTLVIFAVVLGVLNTILRPILVILTLPINILTLGLFTLVINTGLILLAEKLVPAFQIGGLLNAFIFGLALSVVNFFLNKLAD
jgi:putative membrane protein